MIIEAATKLTSGKPSTDWLLSASHLPPLVRTIPTSRSCSRRNLLQNSSQLLKGQFLETENNRLSKSGLSKNSVKCWYSDSNTSTDKTDTLSWRWKRTEKRRKGLCFSQIFTQTSLEKYSCIYIQNSALSSLCRSNTRYLLQGTASAPSFTYSKTASRSTCDSTYHARISHSQYTYTA